MLGIFAICLQIVGTIWLLVVVARARSVAGTLSGDNLDTMGPALDELLQSVRSQFREQWPGFALLLVGLILDLVDRVLLSR